MVHPSRPIEHVHSWHTIIVAFGVQILIQELDKAMLPVQLVPQFMDQHPDLSLGRAREHHHLLGPVLGRIKHDRRQHQPPPRLLLAPPRPLSHRRADHDDASTPLAPGHVVALDVPLLRVVGGARGDFRPLVRDAALHGGLLLLLHHGDYRQGVDVQALVASARGSKAVLEHGCFERARDRLQLLGGGSRGGERAGVVNLQRGARARLCRHRVGVAGVVGVRNRAS